MESGNTEQQAWEEVARVISRPARRRKQGIYYTPKWVTDYIVDATMGKFIEENSETPEAIHDVRVLDMACGSGSFLIRAFDELLRLHSEDSRSSGGDLDVRDRTVILRNNIHGVDLDPQAVEVARLNLMLRALARRGNLPSLVDNLKRGNSTIGGDKEELKAYFGEEWELKHAFVWEREFGSIMQDGGFDIIIGNPPYVRIQRIDRTEADYYRANYDAAYGSFDLYVIFVEKALSLLKPGGRLGFITSGKFLKNAYGKRLQQLLTRTATIEEVIDLSAVQVFSDATTYPVIMVFRKGASGDEMAYTSVTQQAGSGFQPPDLKTAPVISAKQRSVVEGIWPPPTTENRRLIDRVNSESDQLGRIASRIFTGIQTSADEIYHLGRLDEASIGTQRVFSKSLAREVEIERELLKPLLSGKHISPYTVLPNDDFLLFPYKMHNEKAILIPAEELSHQYPSCWDYLAANRSALEGRERGRMRHVGWYAYVYPKNLALQQLRKLAIPRL